MTGTIPDSQIHQATLQTKKISTQQEAFENSTFCGPSQNTQERQSLCMCGGMKHSMATDTLGSAGSLVSSARSGISQSFLSLLPWPIFAKFFLKT
jgi:hypothetical protein